MKLPRLLDQVPTDVAPFLDGRALGQYPLAIPDPAIERKLSLISVKELAAATSGDLQLAQCALSGLWLLHGFLDRSHSISQSLSSAEASFWHAIMHRLERDYWNSKYWYRQVGRHEVFQAIGQILELPPGGWDQSSWDAVSFVDLCESANGDLSDQRTQTHLKTIALAEWTALFQYCIKSRG